MNVCGAWLPCHHHPHGHVYIIVVLRCSVIVLLTVRLVATTVVRVLVFARILLVVHIVISESPQPAGASVVPQRDFPGPTSVAPGSSRPVNGGLTRRQCPEGGGRPPQPRPARPRQETVGLGTGAAATAAAI